MPVPDLHKTLERYLAGLKAVIPVAQYEQTKRTVEEFLRANGEGEKLHALLQQYAKEKENWVSLIFTTMQMHMILSSCITIIIANWR